MQLNNNTILITGGGSGIGRGLAEAFHKLGNQVLITGRNQTKLEATVADHPGMVAMALDVADAADIERFSREVLVRFPELNVLINNAGVMLYEDVQAAQLESAEITVATNLLGPLRLTTALLPHLLERPRAAVLNVTSGLAFVPLAGTPTYSATKAALHSYTQSLREQLKNTRVDVFEIAPPYVQTELTGKEHASDPNAMPLAEYLAETMQILGSQADVQEVLVERVKGLRFAEANGTFGEAFGYLSAMGAARLAGQAH